MKKQSKKYGIVNAVSLGSGGGLVVLTQLLNDIIKKGSKYNFIIYVQQGLELPESKYYKLVKINRLSKPKLLFWHAFGFYWRVRKDFPELKKVDIQYILSLQNFNNFFPGVKRYIYFHQLNIIEDLKEFNIPLKERMIMSFIYKPLYWLSIKFSNVIFVQGEWIKKKHFKLFSIKKQKFKIVSPYSYVDKKDILELVNNSQNRLNNFLQDKNYTHLFYPASNMAHKNYSLLIEMARKFMDKHPNEKIKLYLTLRKNEICSKISLAGLENTVVWLGHLPREKVLCYMKEMGALVFPSKLETIGLPLLEAAILQKVIFVSDRIYARELLKDYRNVSYIDYNNVDCWVNSLKEFIANGKKPIGDTSFNVSSNPTLLDLLDMR